MTGRPLLAFSVLALVVDACAGFSVPVIPLSPRGAVGVGGAKRSPPPRRASALAVEDPPSSSPSTPNVRPDAQKTRRRSHRLRRSKRVTVAVVPPPSATAVWDALTKARRELNDPLYHRWPPHANLLYPFLALRDMGDGDGEEIHDDNDGEGEIFERPMLRALERAAAQCEPFEVSLAEGEAFGGSDRGVVWLYPRSYRPGEKQDGNDDNDGDSDDGGDGSAFLRVDPSEPLIQLHASLEKSFPMLVDPRERRGGRFHPHVTLGNYRSMSEAKGALSKVESWWEEMSFEVNEFYVLRRVEDDGQFEIVATVPLGGAASGGDADGRKSGSSIAVHDPPMRFPGMPAEEEGWVREERAKFEQWTELRKARRAVKKLEAKATADGVLVPEIPEKCMGAEEVGGGEGKKDMDAHEQSRRTRMRHRRMHTRRRR